MDLRITWKRLHLKAIKGCSVVVFFSVFFTGCSVEQRYHSHGVSIHWTPPPSVLSAGASAPKSRSTLANKSQFKSLKSLVDTSNYPSENEFRSEYEKMDVPLELLVNFSNQERLHQYFRHDSVMRYHRMVSLYMKDKTVSGKLMGISESGVFIYNRKKSLTGFAKTKNGISQQSIFGSLYYVPYSQISKIQKGGTFDYMLQRVLEPFFQWVSMLVTVILTLGTIILSYRYNSNFNFGDAFEVLLAIFIVIGIVISVIFCIALTLVLTPPLWIWHALLSLLPGRSWEIKGDSYRGEQFFRAMLKSPDLLRIFKR